MSSGYSSLRGTASSKIGGQPQKKSNKRQQLAVYVDTVTTFITPPQNMSVVADYQPYTEKYRYNTLLHHPPSNDGKPYNTSGYFTVKDGAYLSDCTNTIIRTCNEPSKPKFTTE